MIPQRARDLELDIEIWFQDEMRVGQQGRLAYFWGMRGTRPHAPRDVRYEYAWVFGAVCPATGQSAGMVEPYADTAAMNRHLEEISLQVKPGAVALLVCDGAGWHRSRGLVVPQNIVLLCLPPVSPQLNVVETLWLYLRNNYLSNLVMDSYEEIVDRCCVAWNEVAGDVELLKSITRCDWARLAARSGVCQ